MKRMHKGDRGLRVRDQACIYPRWQLIGVSSCNPGRASPRAANVTLDSNDSKAATKRPRSASMPSRLIDWPYWYRFMALKTQFSTLSEPLFEQRMLVAVPHC